MDSHDCVICAKDISIHYKAVTALNNVNLNIEKGRMIGLIGPDGVGKSTLLALISGAKKMQRGSLQVLGGDIRSARHRRKVCPDISYMPQGLGKNLYPTLSVFENVDFFARLFDQDKQERHTRIAHLLKSTGLAPFAHRPAGKLSGGMKQKLGLCCALIHDPELLILDEPTTGVDPLSRRQFWNLIAKIRQSRPTMSVLVATAYMEEACSFDSLVMMNDGEILTTGKPREILERTNTKSLEEAFIELLPAEQKKDAQPIVIDHKVFAQSDPVVIKAQNITKKFGDFCAVKNVSFEIKEGEIYGFLGSNGCGKTTTMKMLTGLLPVSSGETWLFGKKIAETTSEESKNVGYMTQAFSLYSELTVEQNLVLHARLFSIPKEEIQKRVQETMAHFSLEKERNHTPDDLPLGVKQRLSLAVALIHRPKILILDEPTSGVDPVARDTFWREMIRLSREEKVTIFVSTHFMNEAERCDRIAFMHKGEVLEVGKPQEIVEKFEVKSLEEAFVEVLSKAGAEDKVEDSSLSKDYANTQNPKLKRFSLQRLLSYAYRETLELWREPLRLGLALLGSVLLLIAMGNGISFDVEDLSVAVYDNDNSPLSRDYIDSLAGSRYFVLRPEIKSIQDLNQRMISGDISIGIEIPKNFERDIVKGTGTEIAAWIDGSMPLRGETIRSYVYGIHNNWLALQAKKTQMASLIKLPFNIETRFRYNPELKSIVTMVPAVIPLLLIFIPSMLSVLSVVREKELGPITNMYVTPVTKVEFLLGKQLPYVVLAMINFLILVFVGVFGFSVPLQGSFITLFFATLFYVTYSTGFGLVMSSFTNSQVGALFGTAVLTILPSVQFSGLLEPVTSLEGMGKTLGQILPTSYYLLISQGVFSKALGFRELAHFFPYLITGAIIIVLLGIILLKKQEE